MSFFNQYKQVMQLQSARSLGTLIVFMVLQIIIALGVAIGFTYLNSDPGNKQSLLYLATGAPTIVLLITGLVMLPYQVCSARLEGHGEFLRTLPVNRAAIVLADATLAFVLTIPGIIISTLVTHMMFDPGFSIAIGIIPIYLLSALTSIGVGYGFAYAMPPMLAMALSQALAFVVLMFSPVNFPMERLPEWLQAVHQVLPIDSLAQLMRSMLAEGTFAFSWVALVKIAAWCLFGFWAAIKVLNRK